MSGVCGELIDSIVNECVDTFEMAAQGKYDRFVHCIKHKLSTYDLGYRRDWISCGSERLSPDAEYPHNRVAEMAKAPKVLWAFSTLSVIIQEIKKHVSVSLSSDEATHTSACLETVMHAQKVARMLKVRVLINLCLLTRC
jgi:hypothetical protein